MELYKSKIRLDSNLGVYLLLSYFAVLKADGTENSPTAVGAHQSATDGELFMKKLIHGEKISERPEFLLFTAPYRLCTGGCPNVKNFALSFPIYIGNKGKKVYQDVYQRDAVRVHSMKPMAPFRPKKTTTEWPKPAICSSSTVVPEEDDKKITDMELSTSGPKKKFKSCKNYTGMCLHRKAFILMILPILEAADNMPWHQWSWSLPQAPIEYFFRRHANMPIKIPNINSECQCPPHRECVVEFKMNEDMVDFLTLRGVLKGDEVQSYQKDIEDYGKFNGLSPKERIRENRFRRSNNQEEECCCPPYSMMMPTFITDNKFDKVVDSFDKKEVPPSVTIKI